MLSRIRWPIWGLLGLVALSAPLWGPLLLREVPWFRVRHVEVSGTRLLAPHAVLAASGIDRAQNVWDDDAGWESRLRAHPAIAAAEVTRRLPGTLRVRIEEKRPVAYVEAGTLEPATAAGEILPLDPTRAPVDLPIIRAAWANDQAAVRRILAEMGRLTELDPGLIADVSEVRPAKEGKGVLILSHPVAEIVIPPGSTAERLAQLRAVLADVERRLGGAARDSTAAPARVDLRYRDQIVVRLPSSV